MLYVLEKLHVNSCDLMSLTESSTESEGPLASRTRNVAFSAQSREWCDCARTTRKINESSSTDSSFKVFQILTWKQNFLLSPLGPQLWKIGAPIPFLRISFGSTA